LLSSIGELWAANFELSGDKRRQTATEKQLTWNDTLIETSNVQASPTTRRENDLDLNLDLGLDLGLELGIQGSEALGSNKRRSMEESHSGCIHTSLHYKLVRLSELGTEKDSNLIT